MIASSDPNYQWGTGLQWLTGQDCRGRATAPIPDLPPSFTLERSANRRRPNYQLARTLRHEYAHAAIVTLSRGKAPVWLNEGLAQVAEEIDDPGRTGRLKFALANDGLLPLTELEAGFTKLNREQASLAYAEAHAAAQYLLEKKGGYNVRRLLEAMATAESTDAAFHQALGISYAEFEQRCLAELARRLR
jgi:hypothetical protein